MKAGSSPLRAGRRHPNANLDSPLRVLFDRAAAAAGIILAAPLMLPAGLAVWLESGRPLLFSQRRVGRNGVEFDLLKFRSMRQGPAGALLTASGDSRVTKVGKLLRKYKLDELPQLWNVVRGEMSLVGPRPEVPRYVDHTRPEWRAVLQVRPGITDLATLVYRDEENILSGFADVERGYRETVLPAKLALNVEYLRKRSFRLDLKLLALTVRYSFLPAGFDPLKIKKAILSEGKG